MEINMKENIAGYLYYYLDADRKLKSKIIPVELKDLFIQTFGNAIARIDESEVDKFLKEHKK